MSPRRLRTRKRQERLRVRRGLARAVTSGVPRIVVTSPAAEEFRNRIVGGGTTVRLQGEDGEDLFIAGVPITIALPLGALATLTATPGATVLTNADGVAVFDSLLFEGKAGVYTLEFSSPGYVSTSTTGVQVVAGTAVASQTLADVPSGRVGSETAIRIRPRDADGNELLVASGFTTTVQITGTNPVPQTTVAFSSTEGYVFRYTPTAAGTDTVTVRLGGVQISGSPYTSVVTQATGGFHAGSLRVGYFGMQDHVGTGPRQTGGTWDTREPIYRVNLISAPGAADVEAAIDIGDAKDVLIIAIFPGNPGAITDSSGGCSRYSDTKWLQRFNLFTGSTKIRSALARRRLIWYGPDEPWHSHFCNTFTPEIVRNNFRRIKAEWPNSITVGRIEPHFLRQGWGPQTNLPVNYFDKMDYAFATYRGMTRSPTTGLTPRQYFQQAKSVCTAAGYGVGYSHNWPNLGDPADCWPAFGPGDTRSGRIHGENSNLGRAGQIDTCSTSPGDERYWVESPERQLSIVSAAAEDPEAPFCLFWTHAGTGASLGTVFTTLQKRADLVAMGVSAVEIGEARPTFSGWRDPK